MGYIRNSLKNILRYNSGVPELLVGIWMREVDYMPKGIKYLQRTICWGGFVVFAGILLFDASFFVLPDELTYRIMEEIHNYILGYHYTMAAPDPWHVGQLVWFVTVLALEFVAGMLGWQHKLTDRRPGALTIALVSLLLALSYVYMEHAGGLSWCLMYGWPFYAQLGHTFVRVWASWACGYFLSLALDPLSNRSFEKYMSQCGLYIRWRRWMMRRRKSTRVLITVAFVMIALVGGVIASRNALLLLNVAAENGSPMAVKILLTCGADANATDRDSWTPLHHAARSGDLEIAKLLMEYGADIKATSTFGPPPLHWAVSSNSLEVAQLLIDHGAEVRATDSSGRTPLHWAAMEGSLEVAQLLIDHGAEIKATDSDGMTPLHKAASSGSLEVAKLLIEHGTDVNAKDNEGSTPLAIAMEEDYSEIAELLREHGAKE